MLLLATKVLVDQVPDTDRFHLSEDSELLLHLCRQVLPKAARNSSRNERDQEAGAYLRAYYDTVMSNKLRMKPRHVKDLLEIQWEATRGTLYTKKRESEPVLAMYLLDNECCLLFDVPGGVSKYYSLVGKHSVAAVKRACFQVDWRLPLPEELHQELIHLTKTGTSGSLLASALSPTSNDSNQTSDASGEGHARRPRLQLWWDDPERGIDVAPQLSSRLSTADESRTIALKPIRLYFPFLLPQEFEVEGLK